MATVRRMTRPSEVTRERIMKAAERLFAKSGYDGTSIRAIVAKAKVNQAAINYHFEGKDGLYRAVLRAAFRGLTERQLACRRIQFDVTRGGAGAIHPAPAPALARPRQYSRHMRIFNWETVRPTAVFRSLVAEEAAPFLGLASELVHRFCPMPISARLLWLPCGCSGNAAFSCAIANSCRSRRSGLFSTSLQSTGSPPRSAVRSSPD